jgi:broad specificity phosphatase PhoE
MCSRKGPTRSRYRLSLQSGGVLTTLHLVRHGEVLNPNGIVYGALPGHPLSPNGRAQAAETALMIARTGPTVVLSSPLERAVGTAAPVASAVAVDVAVDGRLTEWRLAERWQGCPWSEMHERFPGELEAYATHPDDLPFAPESITAVAERMAAVVSDLDASGEEGAVLVSHQDPIQALRLSLTRRALSGLPHGKPGHCAVITLRRTPAGWEERSVWAPTTASAPFPPVSRPSST